MVLAGVLVESKKECSRTVDWLVVVAGPFVVLLAGGYVEIQSTVALAKFVLVPLGSALAARTLSALLQTPVHQGCFALWLALLAIPTFTQTSITHGCVVNSWFPEDAILVFPTATVSAVTASLRTKKCSVATSCA